MKAQYLKLFFAIILICHSIMTIASPAYPGLVEMKQPDGTTISLYLKGDEKVHWMESEDGYSLMYDNNKTIVYAISDKNGGMTPSSVAVRDISLRSISDQAFLKEIPKKLNYSAEQINILKSIWEIAPESTGSDSGRFRSSIGVAHAICALVDFPDKPFTKSIGDFDILMNQVGYTASPGAVGSVHDYYYENSYTKLDLIITVVGIYRLPQNSDYYGANGSNGSDISSRLQEFALAAAQKAFTDPSVNPADYDNDGDGYIDAFHIIYAGHGEEAGGGANCIWAHKFQFSTQTFGSKKINVYSCSPELRGASGYDITTIGPICHEMCHVFGSPDFYDVDYNNTGNGDYTGTGKWDLMAGGSWNGNGASPAHINMYEKIQLGWVTPETLSQMQTVTGMPNSAKNAVAYRYDTSTSGEYFILENRQKIGFDSYVPGAGLLIYHVSLTSSDISGNKVNNKHPQKMYPVCASATTNPNPTGTPDAYGNINSDGCPFPGSSNNKSFTDYTTPAAIAWNGANTGKPITEIQEQSGVISFKFLMPDPELVNNFQATVVNQNSVQLTWTKPTGDGVIGYNIYRDDQLLIQLTGKDNTSYTQYNVKSGNYNYCIAALYSNKESTSICKNVQITNSPIDNTYLSVRDIEAQSINNGQDIELSWESPYTDNWISYASNFKDYLSLSYTQFVSAVKFTTDDLQKFIGSKLTKVRFPINDLLCKYTIQIWLTTAGSRNPTGSPFFEQVVTNPATPDNNFEVTLNTPVELTGDKDLWIGVKYESSPKVSVGIDLGPMVSGCNFMFTNNQWSSVSSSNNFNWFISGYLQYDSNPLNSPENTWLRATTAASTPQNYVIYRDNVKINTTTQPQYVDTPPSGYHIYCVSIAYADGKESEPVCIEASNIITSLEPVNNVENEIIIYPNPVKRGENLSITCDAGIKSTLSLYSISGQLIQQEQITGPVFEKKMDFNPGIYLLKVNNNSKSFIRKIIIK